MVDIHCHILPDVDDGAETLSDALEMAYLAVSCGVTDLVATSHIRGSREDGPVFAALAIGFRLLAEQYPDCVCFEEQ